MTGGNILVIKLGALGDFIQALGPMQAIRRHHPGSSITLLTTKPFELFGRSCGYFDDIQIDTRPGWRDLKGWLSLRKKLNEGNFSRVYDLQNNDRTSFYLKLFSGRNKPEWVGAAPGASHRNASPERTAGLAFHGHVQTLALAGISGVEIDTMDWAQGSLDPFFAKGLKQPYVLLVPGSAPQRPEKRWPADRYGQLSSYLHKQGYQPVIIGAPGEKALAEKICGICPSALDLAGQTALTDIIILARHAAGAVGNDTGPMHLIAPTGCPALVLFSGHSNPARHAPLGPSVSTIRKDALDGLDCGEVIGRTGASWFRR